MPRSSNEEEVRKRVLAYLRTAEVGRPSNVPIDVRNVERRVQCSPTTIYKYHLDQEITLARQRQANNNPETRKASKRRKERDKMRALAQNLEEQRNINKRLVAQIALVEYNSARLGIDPEELYKPMPKPIRSASRAGTRRTLSKRRR
jgi:hypothetical protein